MLTVDLKRSPKLYMLPAPTPAGWTVLGVVTRGSSDSGALVQIDATGILVQVNAGAIRSLPQREVKLALADALLDDGGAAALSARRGGSSTSEAKRQAARDNGRKGGRPRKSAPTHE